MGPELHRMHGEVGETHWWFVARRQILLAIARDVLYRRTSTSQSSRPLVIEVGCGTGDNVAALAKEYRCLGIDVSTTAIDIARQRFPAYDFILGTAPQDAGEKIELASLILMADVLEHIEDDRSFLADWIGAACPETYFLITVPANPSLWSDHDVAHGHSRRYDFETLPAIWRDLPVAALLVSYFNSRLFPLAKMVRGRSGSTDAHRAIEADIRPPNFAANALLRAVFSGESKRLLSALHGRAKPYKSGLSLIALLRKTPSERDLASPLSQLQHA